MPKGGDCKARWKRPRSAPNVGIRRLLKNGSPHPSKHHTSVCLWIYVYEHTHVCVSVFIYIHLFSIACVYAYVYTQLHMYTYIYMYIDIHVYHHTDPQETRSRPTLLRGGVNPPCTKPKVDKEKEVPHDQPVTLHKGVDKFCMYIYVYTYIYKDKDT